MYIQTIILILLYVKNQEFEIKEVKPELTEEEFDLHVDPIIMVRRNNY